MSKVRKDLDTIVSGAFSDGMMFQAKGTLTNADARKLKDERIKNLLQLFKDTVGKAMPEGNSQHKDRHDWPFDVPCPSCVEYRFIKQCRQNLSKILEEDEVEKETECKNCIELSNPMNVWPPRLCKKHTKQDETEAKKEME